MEDITNIIGQPEGETLEYKAVLPPARAIAQIICAFANTEGGYLILGVNESSGIPEVVGLSDDFRANTITHKAIDQLRPTPNVSYNHVSHESKRIYVIQVEKSDAPILLEGKIYTRSGDRNMISNPEEREFRSGGYDRIGIFAENLEAAKANGTNAKSKFLEHYLSVLNIANDLNTTLYPNNPEIPTDNTEGKILTRILFSSCADTFETYLSDLLYEIYLANPNTLKSNQEVTIKEVLDCADMQDFVTYWAKKKLSKLQRGSVKGFISDNKQISDLEAIDSSQEDEIERILQIRHLYAHQNGRVDEKFLKYYPDEFELNDEHQMSISSVLDKLEYLSNIVELIDQTAIVKYSLATEG